MPNRITTTKITMAKITMAELRATFALSAILSTRLLGLFMILPVFSLYANKLNGNTPLLLGIALGIYGLFQALFQMPFGILSDKIGRKPVITAGLLIFAVGSIIAAMSKSIHGVIIGRALQGAGAIGSTITAYIADLTRVEHRTKAMAILGMTIGLSFTAAMVLGPIINAWVQITGIFWFTAALALCSILLLWTGVPTTISHVATLSAEPKPKLFKAVLFDPDLLRLDFGVFILHSILTASFIAIPLLLQSLQSSPAQAQWHIYLITLILSFIIMMPLIIVAEKRKKLKLALVGSILLIILAETLLFKFPFSLLNIAGSLVIFFTAFNVLEASLPSLIAKIAPSNTRGTAMGIFSSSQYFGIFIGGAVGGWIWQHFHSISAIFLFCILMAVLWLGVALRTKTTQIPH